MASSDIYGATPKPYFAYSSGLFTLVERGKSDFVPYTPNGLCLFGNYPTNWYHWLLGILPQLWVADQLSPSEDVFPILVHQNAERGAFATSLNAVNARQRKVIYLPGSPIRVGTAIVAKSPAHEVPELRDNRMTDFSRYGEFNADELGRFRDFILAREPSARAQPSRRNNTVERIYLSRSRSARRPSGQAADNFFHDLGFTVVHLEALNFWEQVRLFSQAKVIVGPPGAGFANLLFASASTVMILQPRFIRGSPFSRVAQVGSNSLTAFPVHHEETTWRGLDQSRVPWEIDVLSASQALKAL